MAEKTVAMILAGGKGTRLKALTKKIAKPAVYFGGRYRIIDFPLSNVANSGINVCAVLTQYESLALNDYIGNGEIWGFDGVNGRCCTLPPRQTEEGLNWYNGTADAIYRNLDFLDDENPDYVVILSGDHIYKTTYNELIERHKKTGAVCTISVLEVPWEEASRFGILEVDEEDNIVKFVEKPKKPKSNLASMGIYCFTYKDLRKLLVSDARLNTSEHDFGKNIIPTILQKNMKCVAYRFKGYWRDVGTLASLHESNMELLPSRINENTIDLANPPFVYSQDTHSSPQYFGPKAKISDSIVNQGAKIFGKINQCVVSNEAVVEEGAICERSVIMPGARICKKAHIVNAIVGPNTYIGDGEEFGNDEEVTLIDKEKEL